MKRLADKIGAGGFGLALLLLCGTAFASHWSLQKLIENRQWVEHTHQVLATLDQVSDGLVHAAVGQRSYANAQEAIDLEFYNAGIQKTSKGLKAVRQLTIDNFKQQRRLDELEPLVTKRLAQIQQSINLWQRNKSTQRVQIAIAERDKKIQQDIQARLAVMEQEERTLLQQRLAGTDQRVRATILIVAFGYLLSFSLLFGAYFRLQRQNRHRQLAEAELTEAQNQLEIRVQERTAALAESNKSLRIEIVERQRAVREAAQSTAALRKSEELYRLLSQNFPNGSVLLFDQDLRYLLAEGAGLADSGLEKAQLEGKTLWEILLLPAETAEVLEPLYRLALAGQAKISELTYAEKIYRIHTLPVKNEQGEIFAGMMMSQNITIQKQAEQALKNSRDQLEVCVQQRTTELIKANTSLQTEIAERLEAQRQLEILTTELKRSNQELEQFAYVASHDLQEPLRAVAGYTQLLEQEYQDRLDESASEYMGYIVEGATRMQQLIQDLLAYSRLGQHTPAFAPTDCNVVLRQTLDNLQVAIAQSNATITYDSLPTVSADTIQLVQLFQNLIGNAIKFCREEPPQVRIWAEFSKAGDDACPTWLFRVRDNGIGIKPQYLERIFVIFKRLHTRREFPGTGIGLAICKKIVERHGGCIWAESLSGVGTTFHFTLPLISEPSFDPETSSYD